MTLEEARKTQKKEEKRRLTVFSVWICACAIACFLLFYFTDILSISSVFYLLPVLAAGLIVKYCGMLDFLTPKEFRGKIIRLYTFSTRDQVVRGAAWGHGPNVTKAYLATEIMVENEKGKTRIETYRNGNVVSRLSEGDEILILRFIEEQPFLVEAE